MPLLVYIDHNEISCFRQASVQQPARSIPNWRLRQAALARLQPANIARDPYLIGILIALAQAQWLTRSSYTAAHSYSRVVRLYQVPLLANIC
jgi:hypothetical protein